MTPPTLCIHNERAGPNLTPDAYHLLHEQLAENLGEIQLVTTQSIQEVEPLLRKSLQQDIKAVISLGGDGTNHHIVDAMMRIRADHSPQSLPPFAVLPMGTGCDWSRGIGQPLNRAAALSWLARATPHPVDIGELITDNSQGYFLNIASCGLSGEVSRRSQLLTRKHSWSYLIITLRTIWQYQRHHLSIEIDGHHWYEGPAALVACCNGPVFGRGLRVAPSAQIDDGWLDVVLAPQLNYLGLTRLLPSAYLGLPIGRGGLMKSRGETIRISSAQDFLFESDGEGGKSAQTLEIRLHKHALSTLLA